MFASRAQVGVFGLGDTFTPSGPVQQDITQFYQAGLIVGAGGTSPIDISNMTTEQQAAFVQGWDAGNAPVTVAQTQGGAAPGGASNVPPAPAPTPVVANTVVFAGLGIAALFLIMAMVKR